MDWPSKKKKKEKKKPHMPKMKNAKACETVLVLSTKPCSIPGSFYFAKNMFPKKFFTFSGVWSTERIGQWETISQLKEN